MQKAQTPNSPRSPCAVAQPTAEPPAEKVQAAQSQGPVPFLCLVYSFRGLGSFLKKKHFGFFSQNDSEDLIWPF